MLCFAAEQPSVPAKLECERGSQTPPGTIKGLEARNRSLPASRADGAVLPQLAGGQRDTSPCLSPNACVPTKDWVPEQAVAQPREAQLITARPNQLCLSKAAFSSSPICSSLAQEQQQGKALGICHLDPLGIQSHPTHLELPLSPEQLQCLNKPQNVSGDAT